MIEIKNAFFSHPSQEYLISGLHFTLNKGELIFITGESGCGKSTFLKLLNRLLEPTSGSFELHGQRYSSFDTLKLRRKIQLVPQTPFLTQALVIDNLTLASKPEEDRIEMLMDGFNLSLDILHKSGNELSVGQAQRLCVIRALLLKPEVILLDEPTAALDPKNRSDFRSSFEKIRKDEGIATVWVTHDDPEGMEGKILHMENGKLGN